MATLADIDQVRRSIGDTVKENVEQLTGDGLTLLFTLQYKNVQDVMVTVDGVIVTPDLIYAGSGQIQLATAPVEGAKIIVTYEYSAFLDTVLASLIDGYSVDGAIVEALKDLLASASRRADYTQGQTNVKASQIFDNLKDLLAMYSPGGQFSTSSGLTVGRRVPQTRKRDVKPTDLSRSDSWSDNNV